VRFSGVTKAGLRVGDWATVRITSATSHDLRGKLLRAGETQ
jgi:hypothetical protein